MLSSNRSLHPSLAVELLGAMIAAALLATDVSAQGHLRLGMTANDVPLTWGQPDNGFEGYRTPGLMIYDSLINFDLTSADKASGLIPGLAESWEVNKADPTKWTFKLRRGVKFHDGSDFNADAVVFNMDRLFNDKAPQYSVTPPTIVAKTSNCRISSGADARTSPLRIVRSAYEPTAKRPRLTSSPRA